MNEDAHRHALELERRYFDLMNRANRPDIVWDEDAPRWSDTYTEAESPELNGDVDASERELEDYVHAHRAELETHPHWSTWFAHDSEQPDSRGTDAVANRERRRTDDAEQRRADRQQWAQGANPSSPSPRAGTQPGSGRRP